MTAYKLVVTHGAKNDMADARNWYQAQASLGSAFVAQLRSLMELISSNPHAYPVVAHGVRRAVLSRFPYNVYYAINGEFINLLAVWHGSRDQKVLLGKLAGRGDE